MRSVRLINYETIYYYCYLLIISLPRADLRGQYARDDHDVPIIIMTTLYILRRYDKNNYFSNKCLKLSYLVHALTSKRAIFYRGRPFLTEITHFTFWPK